MSINKNSQKTPNLRFKGFTDDWEQRKLGDLGSVVMNKRIFKDETFENGEIPFLKLELLVVSQMRILLVKNLKIIRVNIHIRK